MITVGTSYFKKLHVLIAVLLCSVLTIATPVFSFAAPAAPVTQVQGVDADDDSPFQLVAGEVSSGDAEAILQLDKVQLGQLIQHVLQHVYPEHTNVPAIPAFYAFSRRDSGLHTILTKGP